ncbi:hypothetical protein GFER_07275 [Geoalkalibacter ferrihydriticus DSM 17813]|uniref:AlpA family transcriptional regulator n=1 Tax=Geoalkalibacter ferrihydriticus DSM 17813 TaxID=1121915 RepID=A0A0C2EE57_9BACT|nr:AlpA family phage regulatory protein [Geoalkalibacter ferrihydriticus]KIH76888.1 hypothetical protein GFER_07275 [Geoalkalibacter ferrihydriticus DSM 17813]
MKESKSDKYLSIWQVTTMVNLSKATIYRMIQSGDFPGAYRLSPKRVGWLQSEIQGWMTGRKKMA